MNYEPLGFINWDIFIGEATWIPAVAENMRQRLLAGKQKPPSSIRGVAQDLYNTYVSLIKDGYPEIALNGAPTSHSNRTIALSFGRTYGELVRRSGNDPIIVDAFINSLYFKYLQGVVPARFVYPKRAVREQSDKRSLLGQGDTVFNLPDAQKTVFALGLFTIGAIAVYGFSTRGLPKIVTR